MLWEGLKLMLLGMGFVLVFLSLVLLAMQILGAWFRRFHLLPEGGAVPLAKKTAPDEQLIAVIGAAIQAWRLQQPDQNHANSRPR
ncbi:MAG: OadG family protein [Leptospiraceae bacterium]|nr:OadG family protein [Leptospiraceae bacterium]